MLRSPKRRESTGDTVTETEDSHDNHHVPVFHSNNKCLKTGWKWFHETLELIDEGFYRPHPEVIKRRLETVVLLGALMLSIIAGLSVSVGTEDLDTISIEMRRDTMLFLSQYDTSGLIMVPSLFPRVIAYAKLNLNNSDAWFAKEKGNIYFEAKLSFEKHSLSATVYSFISLYAVTICFVTFNHVHEDLVAVKTWYKVNAFIIYLAMVWLVVSGGGMFGMLRDISFLKGSEVKNYLMFVYIHRVISSGPGFIGLGLSSLGTVFGNRRSRDARKQQAVHKVLSSIKTSSKQQQK